MWTSKLICLPDEMNWESYPLAKMSYVNSPKGYHPVTLTTEYRGKGQEFDKILVAISYEEPIEIKCNCCKNGPKAWWVQPLDLFSENYIFSLFFLKLRKVLLVLILYVFASNFCMFLVVFPLIFHYKCYSQIACCESEETSTMSNKTLFLRYYSAVREHQAN